MKKTTLVLSAALVFAACSQNPKPEAAPAASADTSFVMPDSSAPAVADDAAVRETVSREEASSGSKTEVKPTAAGNSANASESMSTTTNNEARKKKGWSKTAKGAVIGGVVGAGTGAAVSKKDRAKGAVIGGVIGAGAGALIGRDLDKKDGRH